MKRISLQYSFCFLNKLLGLFFLISVTALFPMAVQAQNGARAQQLNQQGEEAMKADRTEQARRLFEQAMIADFLYSEPRYNIARLSLDNRDLPGALENIKKAISLKPYEKRYRTFLQDLYVVMARQHISMNRRDLALDCLDKASKVDENHIPTQLFRQEMHFSEGNFDEANAILKDILSRDDSRTFELDRETRCTVLALYSETLAAAGEYLEAYRQYSRAVRAGTSKNSRAGKILERASAPEYPLLNFLVSGDRAWDDGNIDEAEKNYLKALQLEQNLPGVQTRLKNLSSRRQAIAMVPEIHDLLAAGKLEKAQEKLDILQSLDPEGNDFSSLSGEMTRLRDSLRMKEEKIQDEQREKQLLEAKITYELEQARTFISRKNHASARETLKEILKKYPENNSATELLDRITSLEAEHRLREVKLGEAAKLFSAGEFRKALEAYQPLVDDSADPSLNLQIAQCHLALGDTERAAEGFRRYSNLAPDDSRGLLGLAQIERLQGRPRAAIEILKSSTALAKDSALVATLREIENEIRAAERRALLVNGALVAGVIFIIVFFRRVMAFLPGWRQQRLLQSAKAAAAAKNWTRAMDYYGRYVEIPGISPVDLNRVRLDMARCMLESGRSREALSMLKELSTRDQKNVKLRTLLGHAYMACGETSEAAIDEYRSLMKFESGNLNLLRLMCSYYIREGGSGKEARDIFEMVLAREPDNREVLLGYAGALAQASSTDSKSLTIFSRALETDPSRDDIREAYVRGLHKCGNHEKAADEAYELLKGDSENMAIHKIYSDSMTELGRFEEALDIYREFTSASPDNMPLQSIVRKLQKEFEKSRS